jgi:protein-tyrosine phosphatase
MIDLHCHFLPGIDDGPETMEQALDLARMAVADGVTLSVLTSHIHPERWPNNRTNLKAAVKQFSAELARANISLEVRTGGEARLCPELFDMVAERQVPYLGEVDGFKVLLLEFPHSLIPVGADRLVTALLRHNIRPLIAHPERNKAVMTHPEKIKPFVDLGCWLQLTAGSLAGRFGQPAESTAWKLLESDAWCVVATDAHNREHRPPLLSEGRNAVAARLGQDFADELVTHRPARIVKVDTVPLH